MKMVNKILFFVAVLGAVAAVSVPNAFASVSNYTFQMSLVSITEDPGNAGLFGKPDWYQWLYKVNVVSGGNKHTGLSHFTIELEDCFQGALLEAIESTAGANGISPNPDNLSGLEGNEYRGYDISTGYDGSTGLEGIKWDLDSGSFDSIGDYDYFWFSAPTDEAEENIALVKRGGRPDDPDRTVQTTLDTPKCPECEEPVVPEPATVLLMGAGLVGAVIRRQRHS